MRVILTVMFLIFFNTAFSQINYVLNPDFEQRTSCPNNYDQIKFAKFWSGIDSNSNVSKPCIPEYCHVCAAGTPVGIPRGQGYWQYPHSGEGYAKARIMDVEGTLDIRDYLQGRLFKKLTMGKTYCVSVYVNLVEGSDHATADIGVYFDNGSIDTVKDCGAVQTGYVPQVINSGGILKDTANWVKIQGSFIANGNEQFLTIGNFKDKAHSAYVVMPYNPYQDEMGGTFYLIDDVSVIESDLKADAGPDKHVGKGDSIYIGRPKEVGLECTWTVLGSSTLIGTGAGIWVKPSVTTTYVVSQTLCGATKKDTVRVEVWGVGINSISGQNQAYSLAPNPNEGSFILIQAVSKDGIAQIEIRNLIGQVVFRTTSHFSNGRASLNDGNTLQRGLYYLLLKEENGKKSILQFVKQ